jgi:Family of unknown function (DUF5754)
MDNLLKYSNFKTVQKKANKLYNRDVFLSTRKDKKYMIMDDNNKWVHFGQLGYQDFTKHLDEQRKENYLKRATKIKGNWKDNQFSPNNLSINLLW